MTSCSGAWPLRPSGCTQLHGSQRRSKGGAWALCKEEIFDCVDFEEFTVVGRLSKTNYKRIRKSLWKSLKFDKCRLNIWFERQHLRRRRRLPGLDLRALAFTLRLLTYYPPCQPSWLLHRAFSTHPLQVQLGTSLILPWLQHQGRKMPKKKHQEIMQTLLSNATFFVWGWPCGSKSSQSSSRKDRVTLCYTRQVEVLITMLIMIR